MTDVYEDVRSENLSESKDIRERLNALSESQNQEGTEPGEAVQSPQETTTSSTLALERELVDEVKSPARSAVSEPPSFEATARQLSKELINVSDESSVRFQTLKTPEATKQAPKETVRICLCEFISEKCCDVGIIDEVAISQCSETYGKEVVDSFLAAINPTNEKKFGKNHELIPVREVGSGRCVNFFHTTR